jgi:hypothetical protein
VGRKVLAEPPTKIDVPYLMRYASFIDFRGRRADAATTATSSAPTAGTETPPKRSSRSRGEPYETRWRRNCWSG